MPGRAGAVGVNVTLKVVSPEGSVTNWPTFTAVPSVRVIRKNVVSVRLPIRVTSGPERLSEVVLKEVVQGEANVFSTTRSRVTVVPTPAVPKSIVEL